MILVYQTDTKGYTLRTTVIFFIVIILFHETSIIINSY